MQFIFFEPASDSSSAVRDRVLFIREDAESANWQEEEYSLQAMFPFLSEKEIKRGMRIGFTDEVGDFQAFEIRKVRNYEPDGYQEITAEHIVIAELTDEFTDEQSFTNVPPNVALAAVLSGTQWQVGTVAVGDLQAQQTARQNIAALKLNGNVDLTSRPVVSRAKMRASGYAEFSAESATLYPQIYTWDVEENNAEVTKATFLITPIRQDGVVYSLDRLNDYVLDLYEASQTYADLTAADHDRLLIHVLSGKQLSAIENISDQAETLSAAWESAIVAEASSGDISRGKVWPAVCSIKGNWNVYITPRITWGSTGITGRYLDIETYGGVFRGLYLSIDKNADEMGVTVDDTNVATAMRGFGRNIEDENTQISSPLTFSSVTWTQTADHPAKPSGQNYLENPAAAQYKRYGRHRWGFYQNSSIDDPVILLQKTWEALKQVSGPDYTINCVVRDMYRLGYKDVPMRLHDRAMVYEINTGETLLLEIVNLSHNLLNAMETRPTIGKYIPNIIYINRETNDGKRSFGGGGSKGQSAEEYERGEFETAIDYNKYQIGLRATQYDLKDQSYRTALAQAQIDIQHNAIDSIVGGVGMTLDANGYAVLDANGNPVFNVGSKTVFSRVNQLAEQYAVQVVNNKMSGYLLINDLSTEMGNVMTGSNGETIAANIVTKINNNQGTIYLNSDHVKLKDGSIITASTLDARLANIDKVVANSISANTVVSAATGNFQDLWIYGSSGGNEFAAKVDNAINSITPYTPSDPGKIGFKYTTLANPVGQPVDFNIADTEYYRNHVGIEATGLTVTEIGEAPYNNHSAEAITTPEIKAGTSDKYYLISATAKDGTTTVYKKFTLPAASAPPVTASINDITGTSIAANHIKDTSIPLTASGTNVAAYTENLTLEETTYQVGSITRPCVVLKLDGSVIGRIYTGNSYNRGWDAAAGVVVLPTGSASPGQSMALSVPYARTANGTTTRGTDQITYTLRVDQKYAYISTVGGNDSVINYAKYEHNQYTLGQDSVSASLPTGTPPAGTNASELSPGTYALTLTKGSTPSVLGYYTVPAAAVVTPKVSKGNWSGGSIKFTAGTSGEDEATVALKMSVDTGTNKSTVIKVLDGQTETGNSMTVYLKADNDNCYITSTDYTPNANNTLARITNPKTAPAASIDSIALRKADGHEYVYVDEDREFAVYVRATGTNVSDKDETLYIDAGDAVDHGKRLVSAVLAETATSAAAPSTLVSGKTYNLYRVVDGTRESAVVSSYTVPAAAAPVSASIDDLSGVAIDDDKEREIIPISARGTNVTSRSENVTLKRSTYGSAGNKCVTLTMDGVVIGRISAQIFYTEGRNSVKITSVERVASCAIDDDAQTAEQDVRFTLSNGETYTIHEDFSDVYLAGRAGTSADTTIEYAVDLASEGVYFDTVDEGLTIDVSDIYQAGRDYTPPVLNWYTYSSTGGDVPIYVRGGGSGSSDGVIGSIYEHLNQFHASTSIAFYPYTPVEVVGSLLGYTQVSYNGSTYYVDPSNLTQSETDLSIDHRIGIKDLTVTRTITLSRIVHTAGTSNSVTLTVQREGEKNPSNAVSSYVSLREFNNLTVNDNAGKYFDYLTYLNGYFASHDPKVYGDTITHKAVFTETYVENGETVTEYIVVSFDSYAYVAENEVLWWEITNYYNNYGDNVPVTFTPSNASTAQTLPYSEGYSSLTVTDMNADYYIPGDITYPWSAKYPQMTCRFRIRCHLSDGTTEDVIIKKIAHREEAPSQDAFIGYVYATNGGSVKVRATAGGSEIGSLTPRTEVTVLEKAGSYYKIEFEGVQGYMATAYVSTSSASKSNFSYTGWLKDISYVEIDATESGTDRLVHNGGYTGTIITTLKLPGHNNSYNYRSTNGATLNIFNTHYANPITGSLSYYLGTVNNKGNIATHSQVYKSNLTHRARISVYYADGTNETLNIEFTSVPG